MTMPDTRLDLSSWGLPTPVLQQYQKMGISQMFEWQAECLCTGSVLEGGNLVYSAPTSAGKTMVAELLILKQVVESKKKALFILPFVSVAREKMFSLQKLYQDAGIRVSGFMGSYNPPCGFNNIDIAVCTIEKGNSLINRLLQEDKLTELGAVVIDELHMVGDSNRGYLLELLLTKICYVTKKLKKSNSLTDKPTQIIGMSATLPNLPLLANWLNADLYVTDYRPVPLTECIKLGTAVYNSQLVKLFDVNKDYIVAGDEEHIIPLALQTVLNSHSVLIFCPTRNWCEKLCETIAREFYNIHRYSLEQKTGSKNISDILSLPLDFKALNDIKEQLLRTPTGLDKMLGKTVPYGVAYHHAGLTFEERDIIESAFRQCHVKVLVATSTLSSGVNLPARRVIIRTPIFHGQVIDTLVYKQMIGRAGRKGVDTEGQSILICKGCEKEKVIGLLQTELPPVNSCLIRDNELSSCFKRAILEVVAGGVAVCPEDVASYISCTLLAASADSTTHNTTLHVIDTCLNFLQQNEFVTLKKTVEGEERFCSSQLGLAVLASALSPDDGLMVFADLQKARKCFVLESELHVIFLVTPIYCQEVASNINWYQFYDMWEKLSPAMKKVAELVGVEEAFICRAIRGRILNKTSQQLRAIAIHKRFYTAMVLQELVNEKPVNEIITKFNCNKGQLSSLQQTAATFAGMVTVFCTKLGWNNLELILSQFQSRLTFGVQRELCNLVTITALNAHRARSLYNAGYQTVGAVATADVNVLENILMSSMAFQSNKKQEGESEWEAEKRRNCRCIYLGTRKAVTLMEAAVAIVEEAKFIIQEELGGVGIQWSALKQNQSFKFVTPKIKAGSSNSNVKSSSRKRKNKSRRSKKNTISSPKSEHLSAAGDKTLILTPPASFLHSRNLSLNSTGNADGSLFNLSKIDDINFSDNISDNISNLINQKHEDANKENLESTKSNVRQHLSNFIKQPHPTCFSETNLRKQSLDNSEHKQTSNLGKQSGSEHQQTTNLSKQSGSEHKQTTNLGKQSGSEHKQTTNLGKQSGSEHKQTTNLGKQSGSEHQQTTNLSKQSGSEHKQTTNLGKQSGSEHKQTTNLGKQSGSEHKQTTNLGKQSDSEHQQTTNLGKQPGSEHQQTTNLSKQSGSEHQQTTNLSKQSDSEHQQTTNLSKQSGSEHQQTCNFGKQSGSEHKQTTNLGEQSGSEHKQTTNLGKQSGSEHKQTTNLGKQTSDDDKKRQLTIFEEQIKNNSQIFLDGDSSQSLNELKSSKLNSTNSLAQRKANTIIPVSKCISLSEKQSNIHLSPSRSNLLSPDLYTVNMSLNESDLSMLNINLQEAQKQVCEPEVDLIPDVGIRNIDKGLDKDVVPKDQCDVDSFIVSEYDRLYSYNEAITQNEISISTDNKLACKLQGDMDVSFDIDNSTFDISDSQTKVVHVYQKQGSCSESVSCEPQNLLNTKEKDHLQTPASYTKAYLKKTSTPNLETKRSVKQDTLNITDLWDRRSDHKTFDDALTNSEINKEDHNQDMDIYSTPCRQVRTKQLRKRRKSINYEQKRKIRRDNSPECKDSDFIMKNTSMSSESDVVPPTPPEDKVHVQVMSPGLNKTPCRLESPYRVSGVSHIIDNKKLTNGNISVINTSMLTQQHFTIIDVCSDQVLFKTFITEWKEKDRFSLCVACEEKPKKTCFMNRIGQNFDKQKELNNLDELDLSVHGEDIKNDERVIVGIAVCWEKRDVYYIGLSKSNLQDNPDDTMVGFSLDQSISLSEKLIAIKQVLEKQETTWVGFDIKSQFSVIVRGCGIVPVVNLEDPKIASWLLDPDDKEKNLHGLVTNYLPQDVILLDAIGGSQGNGSLGLQLPAVLSGRIRASTESVLTLKLMDYFLDQLLKEKITTTFMQTEMPSLLTLVRMELNGFGFSNEECEHQKDIMIAKLGELEEDIYKIAGHPFSLTSTEDIAQVLYEEFRLPVNGDLNALPTKTLRSNQRNAKSRPKPHYSTAKDVLEKLKAYHILPAYILEWRRISSTLTKQVFLLQREKLYCERVKMNRIFGVCQVHTSTGRVSMREPNIQNIPKDFNIAISKTHSTSTNKSVDHKEKEQIAVSMRHTFIPFKGSVILAADYSQLELRVIAHLSGDKKLINILNNNEDVFKQIAGQWLNLTPDAVSIEQRQQAKQICYGILYGIGAKSLGEQIGVEENDAGAFIETFKAKYPGLKTYLQSTVENCKKNGYVTTISGRKRYLPSITSTNSKARSQAERQAVNTTVQGTAADIVKTAMINIDHKLQHLYTDTRIPHSCKITDNSIRCLPRGAFLLLQLHDELIYEVSTAEVKHVAQLVKHEMENAVNLTVELQVKIKTGESWGRLQDSIS